MFKYFTILLGFLILNCTSSSEKKNVENTSTNKVNLLKKESISKLKFNDIILDNSAKKLTQEWKSYALINEAILDLKNFKFSFFTKEKDIFNTTLIELKTTIPEALNSQPIKSRVLVLQNQLYRFQEELTIKKQLRKDDIVFIKDVFVALSNLNLQINKKLEKEAQQILKPQ